jgi:hypothetical protein
LYVTTVASVQLQFSALALPLSQLQPCQGSSVTQKLIVYHMIAPGTQAEYFHVMCQQIS